MSEITKKQNMDNHHVPFDLNAFHVAYDTNPQAFCIVQVLKEDEIYQDILFVYANKAYEKMSGFALENLVGHTYTEVIGKPSEQWNAIYGKTAWQGESQSLILPGPEIGAFVSIQCFQIAQGYCGSNVLDMTKEITETQKAKEEGKKNWERIGAERNLYQTILDKSSDMITVIDVETHRIVYANAAAKNVTKDLGVEYVGSLCYESIKHSSASCKDCIIERRDTISEETKELQYGNHTYLMSYRFMEWNGRSVLLEYSEDITEGKKNEIEFQKKVDFIANLKSENLVAKGHHNLTKNKRLNVVGKREGAVVGKENGDYDSLVLQLVESAVTKEKQKELSELLNRHHLIQQFHNGKKDFTVEYRRYMGENQIIWVTLKCSLYEEPGTKDVIGFFYSYDSTDQMQASQIARQLSTMDHLLLGLIDVETHQFKLLYRKSHDVSKEEKTLRDYDGIILKHCSKPEILGDREKLKNDVRVSVICSNLEKKPNYVVDFSVLNSGESANRISLHYHYLDENKDTILFFCSDITESYEQEQKQLAELSKALDMAQVANRAKTDFLSRMSHDMRTPMNGVLGIVTLLQDEEMPDHIRDGLRQIQMSGKYLLNLINDTLDVNKIESNRLELHKSVTDAFKLTENIVTNAKMLAAEKGVKFELVQINPEEVTPTILLLDEARTEQLCMNLISNAIKFTPEGGHVWVTIERLETTDQYIKNRYQVKDTGIGMSKEFLEHLYEPFSQEGRMNVNRESGTGLGMAIVLQLVKLMDGELQVESEINVGTTFTCTVSFARCEDDFRNTDQADTNAIDLSEKHILLCEDHPLNREIAVKLLEKKHIIVDAVEDGMLGLQMFENAAVNFYDAVLMDIRMPNMNGFEATKRIRELERADAGTVPIIAMTANAFDEDIKECLDAGMDAHISKPIEVDKMYRTISETIERKHGIGVR